MIILNINVFYEESNLVIVDYDAFKNSLLDD